MPDPDLIQLQDALRRLKTELASTQRDNISAEQVREAIFGLSKHIAHPPPWVSYPRTSTSSANVPVLHLSDLHFGEVVDPQQINNINKYDIPIARARLRKVVERCIDRCTDFAGYTYSGIVLCLGGDMVSGDIHEELQETNEKPILPAVLDLFDIMVWVINRLAEHFGNVFVTGVAGNHGRNHKKPKAKMRSYSNYDWLLYQMIEKHFMTVKDQRVSFSFPSGADSRFDVYSKRYLLSHGDNLGVKGGDGIIGALGPIIRGDTKTRGTYTQLGMAYDTLIIGHWHQFIPLPSIMVNGSLKGYDEYATLSRFKVEAPSQSLWFVNAKYGQSYAMRLYAEEPAHGAKTPWIKHVR